MAQTTLRWFSCGRNSPRNQLSRALFLLPSLLFAADTVPAVSLQLQVTEGDGAIVAAGSRSYGGFTVLVTDGRGQPVPLASVLFRLPTPDPTGRFPSGLSLEEQQTDSSGKASVWGIQWSQKEGVCQVAITARLGQATAGTLASVRIVSKAPPPKAESAPPAVSVSTAGGPVKFVPATEPSFEVPVVSRVPDPPKREQPPADSDETIPPPADVKPGVVWTPTSGADLKVSHPRPKWVLYLLGAAGAAGGLVAYRMSQSATSPLPSAVPVTPVLTLRPPTIVIGRP